MESNGTVSLLQGDEHFFNRILSRDSSKGFSSRIYYRTTEGVPFQWETQPGKPKNPPTKGSIPPLSPPPAVLSSGLARPCIQPAKHTPRSRVWFWKKNKKSRVGKKKQTGSREDVFDTDGSDGQEGSDSDSIFSPRNSSSSSASSLSSSFNSFNSSSMPSSKVSSLPRSPKVAADLVRRGGVKGLDWPWSCTPWSFTGVLVCVARKI